jgi:hypothetical protein
VNRPSRSRRPATGCGLFLRNEIGPSIRQNDSFILFFCFGTIEIFSPSASEAQNILLRRISSVCRLRPTRRHHSQKKRPPTEATSTPCIADSMLRRSPARDAAATTVAACTHKTWAAPTAPGISATRDLFDDRGRVLELRKKAGRTRGLRAGHDGHRSQRKCRCRQGQSEFFHKALLHAKRERETNSVCTVAWSRVSEAPGHNEKSCRNYSLHIRFTIERLLANRRQGRVTQQRKNKQ